MNVLIFYVVFLSVVFTNSFLSASLNILREIPQSDKKHLEELFEHFIYKTTFPYTIFGDKPVSWDVIYLPTFPQIKTNKKIIYRGFEHRNPIWAQWKIWKNYEKFLPITNYLFIEENFVTEPFRKDIFIINKKKFIEVVNVNQDLFQKNGDELLIEIENSSSLRSVIKNDELLLGILLGFGRYNASLYQEREFLVSLYERYKNLLLKDSPALNGVKEKIEKITSKLKFSGEIHSFPATIGNVQFVADPDHPETRIIKNKYLQQKRKINLIYSQGNILEITLDELTK